MAVSAYMYFLFEGADRKPKSPEADFWGSISALFGSESRAFRVGAPCFRQKEGGVFRKRLLLSGEMLTSFSKRQGALVSCSFFIPVLK